MSVTSAASAAVSVDALYLPPRDHGESPRPVVLFLTSSPREIIRIESVVFGTKEIWAPEGFALAEHSPVYWCRVSSRGDGRVGWSEIRFLTAKGYVPTGTMEIAYSAGDEKGTLIVDLPDTPSKLDWQGIRFSRNPPTLWIGLRNRGGTGTKLKDVLVSGKERVDEASSRDAQDGRVPGGSVMDGDNQGEESPAGGLAIPPGRTLVVSIPVGKTNLSAREVTLVCRTEDEDCAVARLRPDGRFPIRTDKGDNPDGFEFDEGNIPGKCLMTCPTHKHGTYEEAAAKLIEISSEHRRLESDRIGYVFPCKAAQEDGLTIFSPLADAVLTNPMESLPEEGKGKVESRSGILARHAFRSAVPAPWYAVISAISDNRIKHLKTRPPTYEELRLLVWESIGSGAKGLFYRGTEADFKAAGVRSINSEVRSYLPELAYAIPVESRDIADGKAHLSVLQAGYKELIVILTNNTLCYADRSGTPTSIELLRDLKAEFPIPAGFTIDPEAEGVEVTTAENGEQICALTVRFFRHVHIQRLPLVPITRIPLVPIDQTD